MSREQAAIAAEQSTEQGPAASTTPPVAEQSATAVNPNAEGGAAPAANAAPEPNSVGGEQAAEASAVANSPEGADVVPTATDTLETGAASLADGDFYGIPSPWIEKAQDLLEVGGPVVWILTAMSFIALTIVLVKLWQFLMLRAESQADVRQALRLWRAGEHTAALGCLKTRRPVSELVAMAMQGLSNAGTDLVLLKDELSRVASVRLAQMRAFLRPLEVIATLSPLLGLLGTVLGMIMAFQQMEAAGNQVDPSVLSGGIWQALLTTAVGLAVAIPVVAAHTWLERKVERVAAAMDDMVTQVFTQFKPEAELESASDDLKSAEVVKRAA